MILYVEKPLLQCCAKSDLLQSILLIELDDSIKSDEVLPLSLKLCLTRIRNISVFRRLQGTIGLLLLFDGTAAG